MMRQIDGTRKRASKSVAVPHVAVDQDLYSGLMRLYVVQHTSGGGHIGVGNAREVGGPRVPHQSRHAVPMLHGLEKKGYLSSCQATPLGRMAQTTAKDKIHELFRDDITEGD